MRTWLRRAMLGLLLIAVSSPPGRAQSNVRIAIDVDARTAVQLSIDAALRRMSGRKCQEVFESFSIVVPAGDPVPIWFVDAGESDVCRSPALAFTSPGSRLVHLCTKRFRETFSNQRALAEAIIIHEILHVYGLRESPPSSGTITARVVEGCVRATDGGSSYGNRSVLPNSRRLDRMVSLTGLWP